MFIGSHIKKIRREREMTQEQLAEHLGITANAVSQWECDRTAPDISQLPMLARVLRVTTDRLLGIDFSKDEEDIQRILDESISCYRTGQFTKSVEIARNGLQQYPQSFRLMAQLAESLLSVKDSETEIERLCDKILKECTESDPRDHAYRLKIILYGKQGKNNEVMELANKLPHIWVSKEEMLLRWNFDNSEERRMDLIRYAKLHVESLTICLEKIARLSCYTTEEKIQIRTQIINIMKVIYPESDYLFQAAIMASEYYVIASLYIQLREYDQALCALEKACEYWNYCEYNDGINVSLAFRGYNRGKMHTDERSYCQEFVDLINHDSNFDPIRNHPRYIEIMKKIIKT